MKLLKLIVLTIPFLLIVIVLACKEKVPVDPLPSPTPICQINNGKYMSLGVLTHPNEFKKLSGHVLNKKFLTREKGISKLDQSMKISMSLHLRNEQELDRFLEDLYQPGSKDFHKYLSTADFVKRFGPSQNDVLKVTDFLTAQGFQNISVDENRLLVHAQGKISQVNTAFHTEIHEYASDKGEGFLAPAYELQVPSDLPIQAVHGLETLSRWHTHLKEGLSPSAATPNGFNPRDIRNAYVVPTDLDGTGQILGLFQLDGFTDSDIKAYARYFSLNNTPLKTILVDGFSGKAGNNSAEVTLDIELMMALAPSATQIMVYEGPNTSQGVLAVYNKIASDNLAKSVSSSWGLPEASSGRAFIESEHAIFKQMAAQGQSMYSASGDFGAYDDKATLSVDDPSSQPFVVGVGGTRLSVNTDGSYLRETTWGGGSQPGSSGGGGGISALWLMPNWQKGVVSAASKGSTTMRNVPDVSLNSDPATGYSIYYRGGWVVYGGTSCAAPLWAAYTGLVNQERAKRGLASLGFPNPLFYQIGQGPNYKSDFHDIADKSTNLFYPAVQGYDDATGWGTPLGENLILDLASDQAPVPTPSSFPSTTPSALPSATPIPVCEVN